MTHNRFPILDDSTDDLFQWSFLFDFFFERLDLLFLHFLFFFALIFRHDLLFLVILDSNSNVVLHLLHILFGFIKEHQRIFMFEIIEYSFVFEVNYPLFLVILQKWVQELLNIFCYFLIFRA